MDELLESLRALVNAMEQGVDVGCIEHLDCWDDAAVVWYEPLARAKELLRVADRVL